MSTKTIAIDAKIYERLASTKRESESFSKAIARLLDSVGAAHTGESILSQLSSVPPISDQDADRIMMVVRENHASEKWPEHDLS